MHLRIGTLFVLSALLAGISPFANAQTQGRTASPAAPPLTLAQALASAAPPDTGQVVLTVGADQIKLLDGASPLGESPNFPTIATDFGRALQSFDMVSAIAPPTMTVLNTPPAEPNIYAGLNPASAYTLLLASLSDSQWQELISVAGLPVSDLQTDQQKQLFLDLLSHDGKLILSPKYHVDETPNEKDDIDKTDSIPEARLRLGQSLSFMVFAKEGAAGYEPMDVPPPDDSPRMYQVDDRNNFSGSSDTDGGVRVRADVPNVPKQSQLDYSARALQTPVSIAGVNTVGDMIARIASVTHVEIYADKRIEIQPVTYIGSNSANASDLLEALAFCVTGTYRQVGPAFVLTNDIVGVGTMRQLWMDFDNEVNILRQSPVAQADAAINARRSPKDLSWFDDPTAYSPEEANSATPLYTKDPRMLPTLSLPLSQLTPAQQDMVQRGVAWFNKYYAPVVTTDKNIMLSPGLRVQLIVPGIDQPVDLELNEGQAYLFKPLADPQSLASAQNYATIAFGSTAPAELTKLVGALKALPRRAAIAHARTAVGVDADIAAMKALGLNEMWLDVFSDGEAHIPGSPLTQFPHPLKSGENDILTEAIVKGKAAGIAVFPMMDLLFWGQSPPADAADLNILGETSAQASANWWQLWAMTPPPHEMGDADTVGGIVPDFPGVAVAPLSRTVFANLAALVRIVARRPGIAGIVWREEDPPGYDKTGNGLRNSSLLLGYNEPTRLAFLRKEHADPIDIWPVGDSISSANVDLPYFSENSYENDNDNLTYQLGTAWAQFRADSRLDFLRALYAAANPIGSTALRPIIVKQLRPGHAAFMDGNDHVSYLDGWYGSWDDPRHDPPTLLGWGDYSPRPQPPAAASADDQAKQQSRVVLKPVTFTQLNTFAQMFPSAAGSAQSGKAAVQSGVVLDLADSPFGDNGNGSDPLTDLASDLTPKAKTGSAPGP